MCAEDGGRPRLCHVGHELGRFLSLDNIKNEKHEPSRNWQNASKENGQNGSITCCTS